MSILKRFAVAAASAFAFTATAQVVAPTVADYVTDGLVVHWDAINNVAADQPHDNASTVWNDLTGNGFNWNIAGGASWDETALVMKGTAKCGDMSSKKVADFEYKIKTVEFVFANGKADDGIIFTPGFGATTYLYTDKQKRVGFYGPNGGTRYGCYTVLDELNSFSVVYTRGENDARPSGCTSLRFNATDTAFSSMGDYWEKSMYNIQLGARNGSSPYAKGRLCAIRIYNRVLTTQEMDQNYRIDQYRFLGLTKRFNMVAAENASTVEELTFTDEESGDPIPAENFDVVFHPVDNDGVRRITAVGKAGSGYDKVFNSVHQQTSALPYYAITFDCPTDYVDVTIVGEEGKVKGDTYEFGSQVTITATAKDGVTPFGRWLVGVPEEDALKASITYTVGEENYLVPYFVFPWVYANGKLSDGYVEVPATANGTQLTTAQGVTYLVPVLSEIDFTKSIADGYSLVGIGSETFLNDTRVTTVRLPGTVTTLGTYAFAGCTKLKDVYGTGNLEVLAAYAFQQCSALRGFEGTDDVILTNLKSFGRAIFAACPGLKGKVVLDGENVAFDTSAVTNLGIFEGCTGIKEMVIGDGISAIGTSPFYNCSAITNMTIGTGLGGNLPRLLAFGCSSLKTFSSAAEIKSIGVGAFEGCGSLASFNGSPDLVLEHLEEIGKAAFVNCSSLAGKVIISGKDIQYINDGQHGSGFFEKCSKIKEANISGLANLRDWTFLDCGSLTNVVVNMGVPTVAYGDRTFGNCGKLVRISMDAFPTTSSNANAFRNDKNGGRYPAKTKRFAVPPTPEWLAFIGNPDYVTPWAELSDADKAAFASNCPGLKKPYGLIKVDNTADGVPMPINQWIGLIPQEGTLMFIK